MLVEREIFLNERAKSSWWEVWQGEDWQAGVLHKKSHKEAHQKTHKEAHKEIHIEIHKEAHKEVHKEAHKEVHKEAHQKTHKEAHTHTQFSPRIFLPPDFHLKLETLFSTLKSFSSKSKSHRMMF